MSTDGNEHWHGTLGGYNNHYCRCDRCTEANREYRRDYRRRHPERNNASGRPKEEMLAAREVC